MENYVDLTKSLDGFIDGSIATGSMKRAVYPACNGLLFLTHAFEDSQRHLNHLFFDVNELTWNVNMVIMSPN